MDRIFVGSWDCKLYAITTKGELLWTFPTSLSFIAPINPETRNESPKTFQVVWQDDKPKDDLDKYKEKSGEIEFGGYGDLNLGYKMMDTSYVKTKKKRYG